MLARRLLAELVDLGLATALAALVSELVAQVIRGAPLSWLTTDSNYQVLFLWSIACVGTTAVFAYRWHRGEPTPGYWLFGLKLRDAATRGVLASGQAFARWIVLFAPITLWVYPLVVRTVFDPRQFLILIEFPAWLNALMVLPAAWYLGLAFAVARSVDGRGWHDRVSGAVVLPAAREAVAASA
jgi:hypothetical protein